MRRCEVRAVIETELDGQIEDHGAVLFYAPRAPLFPVLRDYLEQHLNHTLTTETVREDLRALQGFQLREWSLDPTLRQRLREETDGYLASYSPFGAGGAVIPRGQATEAADLILAPDGPQVILLNGIAGSGKSGVVRQIIERLEAAGVTHWALRIDWYLSLSHPRDFGEQLTGRPESPVTTLKGLEPAAVSVLILDQVDAVSELSGRDGAVKGALLRMVEEARRLGTVKIVLVCRTFDLDGDARLKALDREERVHRIEVPLLDWAEEVAPLLRVQGRDPAVFTERQRELLRLPLHLAIYLEVAGDAPGFQSRNDLLAALLDRKDREVRQGPNPPLWSVGQVLTKLAEWMSDRQRLDAPAAVIQDYPGAADLLASAGLIVCSRQPRQQIGFFHESLFDYLYARAFVVGDQPLVGLLTSTEQHLFRRTQVRQILETLRQEDPGRYLTELRSVLTGPDVRYHVRQAAAQWVGSLSDPSDRERQLILDLDTGRGRLNPLYRAALQRAFWTSPGWFDALHGAGWIDATLSGDDETRRHACLWWLNIRAMNRSTEVAAILKRWWAKDPACGLRILPLFRHPLNAASDEGLIELCIALIQSNPPGLFDQYPWHMLLRGNKDATADASVRILAAIFDAWFAAFPDQHPFQRTDTVGKERGFPAPPGMHDLVIITEQAPLPFLDAALPALTRSIEIIRQRTSDGGYDGSFSDRNQGEPVTSEAGFLSLVRTALRHSAATDPEIARMYLARLDPARHSALLHLHLETIAANGAALAEHLLTLLDQEALFKAGWSDVGWQSFAEAAHAAMPHLSVDDRRRLERVILSNDPALDWAKRVAHAPLDQYTETITAKRSRVINELTAAGFQPWCILQTIGDEHLSPFGRQRLGELRRKFTGDTLPRPNEHRMLRDPVPIQPDKAKHMKDHHWLGAIAKYASNDRISLGTESIWRPASRVAAEFGAAASREPKRFAALAERIPDDANPDYLSELLQGLARADGADAPFLRQAILSAHGRPGFPFGKQISEIIRHNPKLAADSQVFLTLAWYIEHGDATDAPVVGNELMGREIVTVDDLISSLGGLHIRGINDARGTATEALAAVVWELPERAEAIWEIIERQIDLELLISVRCSVSRVLYALFNHGKDRCAAAMERLILPPSGTSVANPAPDSPLWLAPAATPDAVVLFRYLRYWTPQAATRLANALASSSDERIHLLGSWLFFCWSFYDQGDCEVADRLITYGPIHRRLAASVAGNVLSWAEDRSRVEQQLATFFDDEDKEVRWQAQHAFFDIKPEDFQRFRRLAGHFIESRAFLDENGHAFFHALATAACDVSALVIRTAERIIEAQTQDTTASIPSVHDLGYLTDLLKREYAESEGEPVLRRRLLDLLDTMLAMDISGAQDVIQAHERD